MTAMSNHTDQLMSLISARAGTDKPSPSDVARFLSLLTEEATKNDWENSEKFEGRVADLRNLFGSFTTPHTFRVGDIVRWKQGMKNRKRPAYGEPAIVVELLSEPVSDSTDESGSPYFRENLDVVLGVIDSDGDLITFHYDRRRFEPVTTAKEG
jgi:hypothetical protein